MVNEKETKERFVKMLRDRQIIVIQSSKPNRKTYDYKIIGANSEGKWDFTPMAAELSYYANNSSTQIKRLAIRSPHSSDDVITSVLEGLQKEGLFNCYKDLYQLHVYAQEHIATFFI